MFGRGGSSSHTPPCAKWQALNRHIQSHNLALALEYLVEWQCKVARAVRCVAVVTAAGVRRCRCWLLQTLQVWRKMTMQSMGMQDKARLRQPLQHNKDKAAVFALWECAIHVATMSRRDLRIHNMLTLTAWARSGRAQTAKWMSLPWACHTFARSAVSIVSGQSALL
jgi:hypothetical protein